MRFLKLWPGVMFATIPPYACMVYNRSLPCSLPLCVLRRSDRICRKNPFVVPPRVKKWIFLLCSSIVIRKCQISFLLYFNITKFTHVYESGAGRLPRNETLPRSYFGHEVTRHRTVEFPFFSCVRKKRSEAWKPRLILFGLQIAVGTRK